MFNFTFRGDGIKAFHNALCRAEQLKAVVLFNLLFAHGRYGEDSHACLTEYLEECAVVELTGNFRTDSVGIEPLIQHLPQHGASCGEKKRLTVQRARKIFFTTRYDGF